MNPQLRRFALDFGPLLLFFAAYELFNLYVATATVMAAATVALGIGYWIDRKIHPVPLTTVVLLAVFGGLTLYLKNDMFIKIKPTIIYALLGMLLAGGEIFNRSVAKYILGVAVSLDGAGWRGITWRFAGFFFGMALLNELIWRNFSTEVWAPYHTFGAIALTFLFGISQAPFLLKHQVETETTHPD
jgi:intracellular septation protein